MASVVLLGVCDAPLSLTDDAAATYRVNKIGGKPNWTPGYNSPESPLLCGICGKPLALTVQIHAPLENDELRTLYIFSCPNWQCTNQRAGWRLLRAQGQHPPRGVEKDEGVMNEVEQAMAGLSFASDSAWDDGSTSVENDIETDFEQLLHARDALSSSVNSANKSEVVAVSSASVDKAHGEVQAWYAARYLNVEEEPESITLDAHEERLLKEYEQQGAGGAAEWNEQHESVHMRHSDKVFHRFVKRLERLPTQCLRYAYDDAPLKASTTTEPVPVCAACTGPRVFELQLLPYLMSCLKPLDTRTSMRATELDWATVCMYTCQNSCSAGGDEFVVVQQDPDALAVNAKQIPRQ